MGADNTTALRLLPKIDDLLLSLVDKEPRIFIAKTILKKICQDVVERKRQALLSGARKEATKEALREEIIDEIAARVDALFSPRLKKVINATGVILHTNLGRSPLGPGALYNLMMVAVGYSNLEFSLIDGKRGSRYDNIRELISLVTGAEDVVIVNNNAAAVLLILDTFAHHKEVIVSRGELVEIGGGFRVPEVMQKSGALLKEVGTTNRTRIDDYKKAIGDDTALMMKIHTSNFKMVGFCEDVPLANLVALGKERGIPVCYDLGSGSLIDLSRYGIEGEPMLMDVLSSGVDVVSFSGDKLLGGPQAGIIIGKKKSIAALRQNPLNRALRIDKLTLAALEGTFIDYLMAEDGVREAIYPVKCISRDLDSLKKSARRLIKKIKNECGDSFSLSITGGDSFVGGGALPGYEIPSILVAASHGALSAERIAADLRLCGTSVITRVANDLVLFDLRTIEEGEYDDIATALNLVLKNGLPANG